MKRNTLSYTALVAMTLLFSFPSSSQNLGIDSLIARLKTTSGLEKVKTYIILSERATFVSPKKSIDYAMEGLEYARSIHDKRGEADLLSSVGYAYSHVTDYVNALKYAQESVVLSQSVKDDTTSAAAYSTLGIVYGYIGQYSKALENHLIALKFREKTDDRKRIPASLNNIGLIYYYIGEQDKAIDYFSRSVALREGLHDTLGIIRTTNNLALAQYKHGEGIEALKTLENIKKYSTDAGTLQGNAYTKLNYGIICSGLGRYADAIPSLREAARLSMDLNQYYGTIQAYNEIGSIHRKQGKIREAIQNYEEAAGLASRNGILNELRVSYNGLSTSYEITGNTSKAYRYYKLFSQVKDSIFNQTETNKIADLNMQYVKEKADRELEILRKETTISNLELVRNKYQFRFLIVGIISLVMIIAGLTWRYLYIRKNHREETERKEELERLYNELQEKSSQLRILGGMLPICSSCKKIRNDKGYWEQLEGYIISRSDATFTHGICPDCLQLLYPEYVKKKKFDEAPSEPSDG